MEDKLWQGIPVPHIADSIAEVLRGREGGDTVSPELLERLLPHLCLALPSHTTTCVHLLRSLPDGSGVWEKLQEALKHKKKLHPEVTSMVFLRRPSFLEREILRVLKTYLGANCQNEWWKEAALGISHFKANGEPLDASSTCMNRGKKVNKWVDSPVTLASGVSNEVFCQCIGILGSVAVKSHFSFSATLACRDYLAQVSGKLGVELYKAFPNDLRRLAFLLTLPLATQQKQSDLREPSQLVVIENSLREEMTERGETARQNVCVMLCFFPFWLPALKISRFLDNYLVDSYCAS